MGIIILKTFISLIGKDTILTPSILTNCETYHKQVLRDEKSYGK